MPALKSSSYNPAQDRSLSQQSCRRGEDSLENCRKRQATWYVEPQPFVCWTRGEYLLWEAPERDLVLHAKHCVLFGAVSDRSVVEGRPLAVPRHLLRPVVPPEASFRTREQPPPSKPGNSLHNTQEWHQRVIYLSNMGDYGNEGFQKHAFEP